MDWDDIRYFLAVSRTGSIRGAAIKLDVNHATVSRRINQLEDRLGARFFDKLPTGYVITSAGADVLELAERMEEQANALERKIFGRDTGLAGKLRVTLPQALATHLIMPDLVKFAHNNLDIKLELITSYEALNLTKRQADIAIRLVYENQSPAEHLYGRKLAGLHRAIYWSKKLADSNYSNTDFSALRWVIKEEDGLLPDWALHYGIPQCDNAYIVSDLLTALAAIRDGLGIGILPCYIGDQDSALVRLPASDSKLYGDIWLLTHGDIRNAPRVKAFTDYMADVLRQYADLLEGRDKQTAND